MTYSTHIEQIFRALRQLPEFNQTSNCTIEILPSQLVQGQTIKDHFLCYQCQYVVWKPQQCKKCETLFCKLCIDSSLQKSSLCPYCNLIYESDKIARFIIELLNDYEFNCLQCCNTFKYAKAIEHLQCKLPNQKCLLNCNTEAKIKTRMQMEKHIQTECQNSLVFCDKCQVIMKRFKFASHSCEVGLLKLLNKHKKKFQSFQEIECSLNQRISTAYTTTNSLRLRISELEQVNVAAKKREEKFLEKEKKSSAKTDEMKVILQKAWHSMSNCCERRECCNKKEVAIQVINESAVCIEQITIKSSESSSLNMIKNRRQRTKRRVLVDEISSDNQRPRIRRKEQVDEISSDNLRPRIRRKVQVDEISSDNQRPRIRRKVQVDEISSENYLERLNDDLSYGEEQEDDQEDLEWEEYDDSELNELSF